MHSSTQEETNLGGSLVDSGGSGNQWVNQHSFFVNCLRRYCWLQDTKDIVSPSNSDEYIDRIRFPLSASSGVLLGDQSSKLSCRHVTSSLDVLYLIRELCTISKAIFLRLFELELQFNGILPYQYRRFQDDSSLSETDIDTQLRLGPPYYVKLDKDYPQSLITWRRLMVDLRRPGWEYYHRKQRRLDARPPPLCAELRGDESLFCRCTDDSPMGRRTRDDELTTISSLNVLSHGSEKSTVPLPKIPRLDPSETCRTPGKPQGGEHTRSLFLGMATSDVGYDLGRLSAWSEYLVEGTRELAGALACDVVAKEEQA